MSCHYDLYCTRCKATSGHHINKGASELVALLPFREALETIPPAVWVLDNNSHDTLIHFASEFFFHHRGEDHPIVVRDEYGGIHGSCDQWFKCGCCEASTVCTLPVGHEGAHGKKA